MFRAALCSCSLLMLASGLTVFGQEGPSAPRQLSVTVGKSIVVDSPVDVQRVSVADPAVVEAVGISPVEVVLNGKTPGQTSVIVWQRGGNRLFFDMTVTPRPDKRIDVVRTELARELPNQDVQLSLQGETLYLRGTVSSLVASERAAAIATSMSGKDLKLINLLNVNVSESEPQILLRVRFAEVERNATNELGVNLFSTGAGNTIGRLSTGQFNPPSPANVGAGTSFTLGDALNVFLFRPELDLGATIKALEAQRLIEILAEPNVLAANGKDASFLAGGEYPYPVAQGGGLGIPIITIQFREFGVRLSFTPTLTSRGTIRLRVAPEVSALDFANGFVYQGFTIPGLATRKVETEIELAEKQSFVIAGLLDNRTTENLNRIPGLADIPLLGKLFQSRSRNKSKGELLVLVTPEIVNPIPQGQQPPDLPLSGKFIAEGSQSVPRTPGVEKTGPAAPLPVRTVPVEVLKEEKRIEKEQSEKRSSGASSTPMNYSASSVRGGGR